MRTPSAGLLLILAAAGCRAAAERTPETAAVVAHHGQDVFWTRLQALCGRAYRGRLTDGNASDSAFRRAELVMHVRECSPTGIRIPFHADQDRSRTWVLTRTGQGLRLKHDHRQEFHADAHTAALIPAAATNVWSIELVPGEYFAYGLRREGTDRRFRVEFDLRTPIPAPPPPWGAAP